MRPAPGSSLDPRTEEISWIGVRATGARVGVVTSSGHLAEVLRSFADLLEKTFDPGRSAALTRVATTPDATGRLSLQLSLALGVLGPTGETSTEAEECAAVVHAALGRFPSPFTIERIDAAELLNSPRHLAVIKQRSVEVADDTTSAQAPSRFDRQIESWLDVADLLLAHTEPAILQASFLASSLSAAESVWLEQQSIIADRIHARAIDAANHVLARRAERIVATLTDVSESFAGCLWVGEVVAGSNTPLPRPLIRALATAVSNELDVIHAHQAAPVVAGRARVVGGTVIEYPAPHTAEALQIGLPRPALGDRKLTDLFSITEVAHAFRWPIPIGELAVPTVISQGSQRLQAPAGLPPEGLSLGRDCAGRDVFLGAEGLTSHALLAGGTGSGKSTAMREMARYSLAIGQPFVVIDPHGDLADAIRADAGLAGREVGLISPDEPASLRLDLLGGARLGPIHKQQLRRAFSQLINALTSHFPKDWSGPRFRQLALAALEVVVAASDQYPLGLEDVGRALIDRDFLQEILSKTDTGRSATVLKQHLNDRDHADVGLWAASKFEDIAQSPGATRIFASFLEGVAVGDVLAAGIPLVVDLGGLSRIASTLLGQIVLAATVDHALSREPDERQPFPVFVDEAQRFPAVNLVDALAEGRKFGLRLVLATQDLGRLDYELRDSLLANTATKIVFRSGVQDAARLSPLVGVPMSDLCGLTNLNAFIHIVGHPPFSIELDPPNPLDELPPYLPPTILAAKKPPPNERPEAVGQAHADEFLDLPDPPLTHPRVARSRQLALDLPRDEPRYRKNSTSM